MGSSSSFYSVKIALFWSLHDSIFPPFLLHLEVFKLMFLPPLNKFVSRFTVFLVELSIRCVVEGVDVILTDAQKTLKDGGRKWM